LIYEKWFFDVFSGSDREKALPGSACVPHAVFGVPPNTFRPALSLSAANPRMNPLEQIRAGVGRETRLMAIGLWPRRADGPEGTIALPNPCRLVRVSTENVG
jgi:hypothetical protein